MEQGGFIRKLKEKRDYRLESLYVSHLEEQMSSKELSKSLLSMPMQARCSLLKSLWQLLVELELM